MADNEMFPCYKDLLRLSKCIRVPTNRLQHWSIRKQPPCLSGKTGPETRTYVPSSLRVQSKGIAVVRSGVAYGFTWGWTCFIRRDNSYT